MTSLEALLAQPLGQALGWTLLHFLWQGTLIAGLLAVALTLARKQAAPLRYAMACGALLFMALAPAVTLAKLGAAAPAGDHGVAALERAGTGATPRQAALADPGLSAATRTLSSWVETRFPALQPWMVLSWSLGVTLLSLRYLGGWVAAQRLKGRNTRRAASDWQSTLDRLAARLRVSRPVRLFESAAVRVPTAIGVFKPVVLVPAGALTGIAPAHLEALLAHELAHIRRHDYLVNLLQTAVETVLFYHPAVWWVSRRARIERENCCDDLAIAATGNARLFARALTDLEERRASAFRFQTAADGGVLRRRVMRVIAPEPRSEPFPRPLAAVLALGLVFATGAAFRLSSSEPERASAESFALRSAVAFESTGNGLDKGDPQEECGDCVSGAVTRHSAGGGLVRAAAEEGVKGGVAGGVAGGVRGGIEGGVRGGIEGGIRGGIEQGVPAAIANAIASTIRTALPAAADRVYDAVVLAQASPKPQTPQTPAAEAKPAEKLTLSVDQLIAFKVHGVTPEFIRQVETLGFGRPSPDDLIALRVHGVTPEYVQSIQRTWGRLTLDQIVSLKIHGLTPQYAEEMKRTGLSGLDFDELLSMKIHGITPEYVRSAQASGFGSLDADQVVALKIHGVTAQDAEKWKALGLSRPTFDQVLSAKIHGVTREFVGEMRKLGFSRLDLDDLVSLKIHDVTPRFVAQVRELGFPNADSDEITGLRIHGVSIDELKGYRAAAPKLSLEEVLQLKIHGISAEELRRMLRDGRLSTEDLMEDEDDEEGG